MDERALLARLSVGGVSGDALARDFGLTRAAVWKRIQNLRAAGIEIDGRAGDGYSLPAAVDLLDAESIMRALSPAAMATMAQLDIVWSLPSTNTELLARPVPAQGTAALLAERQTGGRGRRGRQWASPLASHIYLSLSRGFAGGLARLAGLSLAMGVAAAEALRAAGFAEVGLKWPNDLMVSGRKLGGLLVEGGGEMAGPARAVIGIGVNVHMPAAFSAQIDQPWVDLQQLADKPVARNSIASALLGSLLPALEVFESQGLAAFLTRYAALDVLVGRQVQVEEAGRIYHGTALGLAADGALQVQLDGGMRAFHAGEVSVRPS